MSDLQCAAAIVVARHGQAAYESDRWSDAGGSLTAAGREQARELGRSLADRRIAHVYCSPMSRSVQTAEIAAAVLGCAVTVREGLQEFAVGEMAGRDLELDPFADVFSQWMDGELEITVPGGESGQAVVDRVGLVLAELSDVHRGETVLVISHAGAIRISLPYLTGGRRPLTGTYGRVPNCGAVEMKSDADGWVCVSWPEAAPSPVV